MDLQEWIICVLENIKDASNHGYKVTIELDQEVVHDIAKAYEETKFIEIY